MGYLGLVVKLEQREKKVNWAAAESREKVDLLESQVFPVKPAPQEREEKPAPEEELVALDYKDPLEFLE